MAAVPEAVEDQRAVPGTIARTFGGRHWRVVGAVVVGVVLLAISFANDPGGYLGTDTGGKTATLEAMDRRGDWSPDVGYWAEEWDPDGVYHPMYVTTRTDEGWIQITSLPMVMAARPLWSIGGYRATLLLPIAGTVAAALAAAALAGRLGGVRSARRALWLVGLGSPLVVYALDFWEHSIGVAAVLWAVVLIHDALSAASFRAAVAAGAILSFAGTMRTEALVYTVVLVGAACTLCVRDRDLRGAVKLGASTVLGFVPVWLVNVALERAIGGQSRTGRATGAASGGFGDLSLRAEEGLRTTFAMSATSSWGPVVLGIFLAVAVSLATAAGHRVPAERRIWIVTGLVLFTILTVLPGLGFVPGLFPAFPVAAAGLAVPRVSGRALGLSGAAIVALPVVWLFQFIGGAGPQWGGRYTLASAGLLGVVGVVALGAEAVPRIVAGTVGVMCFAVTAHGVLWLSDRSNQIVDLFDQIEAVQDEALVATNPFLLRESGPRVLDAQWLSVGLDGDLDGPARVLRRAGIEKFSVLQDAGGGDPGIAGTTVMGTDEVTAFGDVALEVVHLRFEG